MAILTRVATYPQERLDLTDLRSAEAYAQNDWVNYLKGFNSNKSYVLKGFGITNYSSVFSTAGLSISINDVVLFHSEATSQANGFYVAAGTEADASIIPTASATSYIEADLSVITGANDQRIFIDPSGNGGNGEEFPDQVDTAIFLQVDVTTNTTGFTTGKMPLFEVVTNSSGIAISITDCRNLYFSLGTGGTSPNPNNTYAFPNTPDSTYARKTTPVTATTGADPNPTQGGDKNISDEKKWKDVVMTKLLELGNTTYWTQKASAGTGDILSLIDSALVPASAGARWSWNGTNLSLTDPNGSPLAADVLAKVDIYGTAAVMSLQRQDGQDSTTSIAIADDNVLFIELPTPFVNTSYSGVGSGATNYRVVARSAFVPTATAYWLAYRSGSNVYVRESGVLSTGDTAKVGTPVQVTGKAYPSFFLSPAGNGDGTTFAQALAALPAAGGVILLMDDITVNTTVTIPHNVKVLGRARNAVITLGASGVFVISGDECEFESLKFFTSQTNLASFIDIVGNNFTIEKCTFDSSSTTSTNVYIYVEGNDSVIINNIFKKVLTPSTNTGVKFKVGGSGAVEDDNTFTT